MKQTRMFEKNGRNQLHRLRCQVCAAMKDLVVPWPTQSLLLAGSTKCAAAPEKDTHQSVALDASIFLSIHQDQKTRNPPWVARMGPVELQSR